MFQIPKLTKNVFELDYPRDIILVLINNYYMNISTKIKKTAITLLALIGVVSFGYGVFAQSTPGELAPFWEGEGLQTKHGRIVVMDMGNGYNSNITDPSETVASNYTDLKLYVDSGISAIANLITNSKAYILPSAANEPVNVTLGSSTPDNAATLSVTGNILATAYTDLADTGDRYLCADANGRIELCGDSPSGPSDPTPINGQCHSFPSAYPSQPADETNGCLAGEFGELDDSDTEFLWECQGDGGTTDSCSAMIDSTPDPELPQCEEYTATYTSQPASNTANGCVVGTFSDLPDDLENQWQWICGNAQGTQTCYADKPICEDPVITLDDITVTEDPSVESGPNGIISLVFDDMVYENADIEVAISGGSSVPNSGPTDFSQMSSGNYANITWDVSFTGNCLSNGQEVTSNVIQVTGSSITSPNTCTPADKLWIDGSSFQWGGDGYDFYNSSQNTINVIANPDLACGEYLVSGTDLTWYKQECISAGTPNGPTNGNYFKYTLNDNDLIYTDSAGVPINYPTNNTPSYPTIGSPTPWMEGDGGGGNYEYYRYVPVANVC
jgi:hypothetical protein